MAPPALAKLAGNGILMGAEEANPLAGFDLINGGLTKPGQVGPQALEESTKGAVKVGAGDPGLRDLQFWNPLSLPWQNKCQDRSPR